ncbi:GNAT family N-acetyltransferase [Grimontia kaedaensis]|uniref:GNAT family N-acetyltransferase n=1 Tax=Grimontia kaedaensis TaxID=2872157 RepID=A0ABY4X1T8_9GAMM|nr:GNAT family N-acetyltransferase [Grimontia kaedaensis]USH05211.1 GNAT family N-acetyltransferase [Grimontia kaedaensis]
MKVITHRLATIEDYEFLLEVKKQAEGKVVEAVFGWDDDVQRRIHQEEWEDAIPQVIELDGKRIGSFLLQKYDDHYYFRRFFVWPECQGKGIGSSILHACLDKADSEGLPVKLSYLQGNRVSLLYQRFGFKYVNEDEHFVYMERRAKS